MYRLFAGIEIPREIGEELKAISKKVTGASWRPIENYHITLRFMGQVDRNTAEDLDHELSLIEAKQIQLTLSGAGWFGSSEPTALWAGVEADEGLTRLAERCDRAAKRVGL